ncbi:MAG: DUF4232 domain-containing protein [Cryobacterium sp.]|nr:DUF4232 domain-containing protein [Cryobacterium sp.]
MPRRISLVVPSFAVLLLAGCVTVVSPPSSSPSSSSSASSPSASPSPAPEQFAPGAPANQCLTANLSVSVQEASASSGHLHSLIVFTNNGPECALSGFPSVQVMSSGVTMGASSEDDSSASPTVVTVPSGGTAVALLTSVNIDPDGGPLGDACVVDHGSGYDVTPPHSLSPISVDDDNLAACSNGAVWMTVGPVTAP